jgi:hypothetical protein
MPFENFKLELKCYCSIMFKLELLCYDIFLILLFEFDVQTFLESLNISISWCISVGDYL